LNQQFESRESKNGYEVTVRIESNDGDQPIVVEKKTTFVTFPVNYDDLVDEVRDEFLQKYEE
jgi:hypothetical protein